jgi:hypothetical protein
MNTQRIACSSVVLTLVTLVSGACFDGRGSGLTGVFGGGNGGTGSGGPIVLRFVAQPNTANAGQIMSVVQVLASDSVGNIASRFTGVIRVSLASNSTGAGLRGTTAARAFNGVATFNGLSVDRPGTYRLQASASGAGAITSDPFTITPVTP